MVRCNGRHRTRSHLRHAFRLAAASRNRRIRRVSLVLQDFYSSFSGRASRTRQRRYLGGSGARTGISHAVRRRIDGQIRMAPILHRARSGQLAVAGALAEMDAKEIDSDSAERA